MKCKIWSSCKQLCFLYTTYWLLQSTRQTCAASEDLSLWSHLKALNCTRLIEIGLSNYHFYDDSGLNKANVDTPIMMATKDWANEGAELILDLHTECLLRILITDNYFKNLMKDVYYVRIRMMREIQGKVFEHFLVVTPCLSCSEHSSSWLHDSVEQLYDWRDYRIDVTYMERPSIVLVELRQNMEEIALIHNIWGLCPKDVSHSCAQTPNLYEVTHLLAATTDVRSIRSWMFYSFSPSNWQLRFNNEQWPFVIRGLFDEYSTDEGNAAIAKYRLRDVIAPPGNSSMKNNYNVPALKLALEIVHNLNGSVHSTYNATTSRPMSGITFIDRNTMPFWHETYFAKSFAYNFLQCAKKGLVVESSDPFLIFQPFDTWTWGYLALSSLALCLALRRFKRYISSFVILRTILQPSFDSKSWITSALLIMWTFGTFLLVNFYSSEIQSLYVVPTKLDSFQNFKQVQQAGYSLDHPRWEAGEMELVEQYYQEYRYGLEYRVVVVDDSFAMDERPYKLDEEFWRLFFGSSKQVLVEDDGLTDNIAQFINELAESERCYVGKEPMVSKVFFWLVSGPNTEMIRSHLGHLAAGGIMEWYLRIFRQEFLAERMMDVKEAIREPALAFVEKGKVGSFGITIQDLKMIFIYASFGLLLSIVFFMLAVSRDIAVRLYVVFNVNRYVVSH